MTVLAVVPSPAVTAAPLFVIEDHLAALIETAELVSPEQEQIAMAPSIYALLQKRCARSPVILFGGRSIPTQP